MTGNPFAVLGLPEWPDLDDETVRAAWRAIAAETHPDRQDGGDLARYTQACAAFAELNSPWGRSEAHADLAEQARSEDSHDDCSGLFYLCLSDEEQPSPVPVTVELSPVPLGEVARLVAEIPARIRHGHPVRMLVRAAAIAGLCLALLTVFPGSSAAGFAVVVLAGLFVVYARADLAPMSRPVRRKGPAGERAGRGNE